MNISQTLNDELARIVEAVVIHSPAAFALAGRASSGIAMPMIGLHVTPEMPPLMNELVMQLYHHCFANRFGGQPAPEQTSRAGSDPEWVDSLARANQSRERWEDGWQVIHAMPNGQVAAKRGNTARTLAPGEFVNLSGSGGVISQGAVVKVYIPRESRTVQSGYYFVFGETLPDASDEISIVRFYWNVTTQGAAELVLGLSTQLNRWEVPFRFKTPSHPELFARTDSAVLYVPRRYAQFARGLLSGIHAKVKPLLRDDVPLFTLHLARGLAFAEDPGTQESFGICRSRILAEGIWLAHAQGVRGTGERLKVVVGQFESQGISLQRPWLNPGSADEFQFAAAAAEAA